MAGFRSIDIHVQLTGRFLGLHRFLLVFRCRIIPYVFDVLLLKARDSSCVAENLQYLKETKRQQYVRSE